MKKKKPTNWGGKRQGAGRPPKVVDCRDRNVVMYVTELEKDLLLKKYTNTRGMVNFLLNNL